MNVTVSQHARQITFSPCKHGVISLTRKKDLLYLQKAPIFVSYLTALVTYPFSCNFWLPRPWISTWSSFKTSTRACKIWQSNIQSESTIRKSHWSQLSLEAWSSCICEICFPFRANNSFRTFRSWNRQSSFDQPRMTSFWLWLRASLMWRIYVSSYICIVVNT